MPGNNRSRYFFAKKRRLENNGSSNHEKSSSCKRPASTQQMSISTFFTKKQKPNEDILDEVKVMKEVPQTDLTCLQEYRIDSDTAVVPVTKPVTHAQSLLVVSDQVEVDLGPAKLEGKPTPLEQQVIDLKRRYPKFLLFVECGYRYRFFGEDAVTAARVLDISCHRDRLFLTASVPTFNGPQYYVRKFLAQGIKVGIVSQTESAASKAVTKATGPFARSVTALFTRTTFMGEEMGVSLAESMAGNPSRNPTSYVMAVCEVGDRLALVAVQPSSGQIVYDDFEDGDTRNELARRLEALKPVEIITAADKMGEVSRNALKFYCNVSSKEVGVEIEELDKGQFNPDMIHEIFKDSTNNIQDIFAQGSEPLKSCLVGLHYYLKDFGFQETLKRSQTIEKFSATDGSFPAMVLPANTLANLEVFSAAGNKDNLNYGTLFHVINRTQTRFGARVLKQWVGAPLTDISKIKQRQEVVEELSSPACSFSADFKDLWNKLMDLEVALMSTFYGRIRPADFLKMCKSFKSFAEAASRYNANTERPMPKLLKDLLDKMTTSFTGITDVLSNLNTEAATAKEVEYESLFHSWEFHPSVTQCQERISQASHDLENHKSEIKKTLGVYSFEYKSVAGSEYLIEVKKSSKTTVPDTWVQVSATKQVVRYQSPFIARKLPELTLAREELKSEGRNGWKEFLKTFNENFHRYQSGVRAIAVLDCLLSLSELAQETGFSKPVFTNEKKIEVKDGRNIVVERLLTGGRQFVANDTVLSSQGPTAMILTGPNMGGKSCYLRQIASIVLLAQIGSFVPASSATLPIFDAIHLRLGARDDLWGGRSTLLVELEEASTILDQVSDKSLVLLDELGRGTSSTDGAAIAKAVLSHLVEKIRCFTVFVTHFSWVTEAERESKDQVANYHMGYVTRDQHIKSDVTFLYKLTGGPTESSFGLNVARMAGIPEDILIKANKISENMKSLIV